MHEVPTQERVGTHEVPTQERVGTHEVPTQERVDTHEVPTRSWVIPLRILPSQPVPSRPLNTISTKSCHQNTQFNMYVYYNI